MAIALPPPITPQQAPLEEIRIAGEQGLVLQYQGIRIYLAGEPVAANWVEAMELQRVITAAGNISDAVRGIGDLYYASGHPATLVRYAVIDPHELYIRVVAARVEDVRGPPEVAPYFANLKGSTGPGASLLERDRVLADTLSERRGQDYRSEWRPAGGDAVIFDLGLPVHNGHQTALAADFSNYGNRYSGPYLADLALRQAFATGDEIMLAGATSVRVLGLGGSRSEPYHEGDAGYSRITRFGVFGLDGRYANFRQDLRDIPTPQGPQDIRLDGTIGFGGLSWLVPVYADFQRRFNFQGKFDRSYETVNPHGTQTKLLSELYNSFEGDFTYLERFDFGDDIVEAQATIAVRKGIGRDKSNDTAANLGYFLWRPSFSLSYMPGLHWTFAGEGNLQLGNSRVPQLEQYVIGGPTQQHAYESGAGVGDRGRSFRLSAAWKDVGDTWLAEHQIRPRAFVEYGRSRLNGTAPGEPAGTVEIADVGFDLEGHFTQWLSATVSVAQSIAERGRDNSATDLATKYVFFQLSAKY